jgi:hypothetical protein
MNESLLFVMYFFPLVRLFRAFSLFIHYTIKCLGQTKISTFRGHFDGFSTTVSLLTSRIKSPLWQQSSNGISFPLVLTTGLLACPTGCHEAYVIVDSWRRSVLARASRDTKDRPC